MCPRPAPQRGIAHLSRTRGRPGRAPRSGSPPAPRSRSRKRRSRQKRPASQAARRATRSANAAAAHRRRARRVRSCRRGGLPLSISLRSPSRFSLQPSCHLAVVPLSSFSLLSLHPLSRRSPLPHSATPPPPAYPLLSSELRKVLCDGGSAPGAAAPAEYGRVAPPADGGTAASHSGEVRRRTTNCGRCVGPGPAALAHTAPHASPLTSHHARVDLYPIISC